jgi:hypothetical protein
MYTSCSLRIGRTTIRRTKPDELIEARDATVLNISTHHNSSYYHLLRILGSMRYVFTIDGTECHLYREALAAVKA